MVIQVWRNYVQSVIFLYTGIYFWVVERINHQFISSSVLNVHNGVVILSFDMLIDNWRTRYQYLSNVWYRCQRAWAEVKATNTTLPNEQSSINSWLLVFFIKLIYIMSDFGWFWLFNSSIPFTWMAQSCNNLLRFSCSVKYWIFGNWSCWSNLSH